MLPSPQSPIGRTISKYMAEAHPAGLTVSEIYDRLVAEMSTAAPAKCSWTCWLFGFLVPSKSAAVAWLEHVLAANPQTLADLIPQWQIATLGAGSQVKRTLQQLLEENPWTDEAMGLWCVPTPPQREILKKGRIKPEQLALELG